VLAEQFAREFAERYVEAWNSHDPERIEPLVTREVVWLDPALPAPARGVEQVKDLMRSAWTAFPDLHFSSGPLWLDPHEDSMSWAWRMEGTHSGPLDMALVARQLGVMPSPGSRFERAGVMLQRAQARFARR
jgi:SnoaL-like domain